MLWFLFVRSPETGDLVAAMVVLSLGAATEIAAVKLGNMFFNVIVTWTMWATVRKFGLDACDLPTMIWNVSVMLRTLTLNIDNNYTKRIPIIYYLTTAVCAISYFYIYLFSMLWFLFVRSPETGDLVAAMVVLSLGAATEIAAVKLGNMFFNVKTIKRIMTEYLECDARIPPSRRFSTNLLMTLRTVKKRAVFFWVFVMVNGVIYCMTPYVVGPERHLTEDVYVIYGLEPSLETPNYEISLVLTTVCVISNCFVCAITMALFMIIVGYSEAQMIALSEELLNIYEDALQEYYNTIRITIKNSYIIVINETARKHINKAIKKRLVKLINIHVANIHLLRQVEQFFRLPTAIGLGCLTVGLLAALLGGLENTYLEVPYTVCPIVMECWAGQKLVDASDRFSLAVYSSKWESFDKHNMKLVLLMLQSSQKTLSLSAGGVPVLSFAFLMSILKSTYSAYTALGSMI